MRRLTLAGLLALPLLVPQAHAQDRAAAAVRAVPDTARAPHFVATFQVPALEPPHSAALAPGGRLGPRTLPALVAARWEARLRAALPSPDVFAPRALAALAPAASPAAQALEGGPSLPPRAPGLLGPYADIGMQLNLRFELKADQFRNLRCTALDQLQALSGCNPGFPTITPTPQYSIRTAGVVARRLHLNVDFDSQREFDANNNIQVWYQGLEDEVLRRVEAGNVTFQVPHSRFISAAIPANNFGVQAIAQVGPLELRGIYAEQKGSVVQDRTFTVGETTTQPVDRVIRDLEYEPGRLFFAIDPAALPGYPAVDILNLDAAALPAPLRVGSLRVYRMHATTSTSATNQNIGGVRAVACGAGGGGAPPVDCAVQRAGPFQWEVLQEGKDYYVDPSGAWFALASRLDQNDYLAVSYVPAGQTGCGPGRPCVGTFPIAASSDPAVVDTLRLVYDPRPGVTAAAPSFRFELRNAYRVGGSEITRETVQLTLTVNQREKTLATGETYLARLGLALPSDPTRFDQYNRLFPRERDPAGGAPLHDYFVIFPHLAPFADSTKLAPAERNDSLYRTPRGLLATQGPPAVFSLAVHADVSLAGDRSTLSLNSFQIRDGSERLSVGGRLLTRGTDYTIDYATGSVQFRNPDSLFAGGATQVRAQFEERAAFAVAPTSIYGLAGRYDLGERGEVDLTGLFQRQQSAFTRPPLGSEPSSSFIGGVSTELHFKPSWVTRALDALPGVHTDAPSFLNVSGEVAVSRPSPNPLGVASVEDFEGETGRFLSLADNSWHWGSVPSTTRGAEPFGFGAVPFDSSNAAALTWQSLPYNRDGSPVQFQAQQIDPTIRTVGQAQSAEPALWIMLKPDTVLGLANSRTGAPNWVRPHQDGPRWRSITQVLSPTGIDLSRVEYLELWVWEDSHRTAKANQTALLIDFGGVFEDALAFVPESLEVAGGDTTYRGYRRTGVGRLDTEVEPLTHSWNAAIDDEGTLSDRVVDGIWDASRGVSLDTLPLCSASDNGGLARYGFGDLRSRCGRHNGAIDSEDLDGDFQLDSAAGVRTAESFVRYVFPIGDDRYYVRDGGMTAVKDSLGNPDGTAGWRLYRIPFRTDTIDVGTPSLRQVQSVRITVVAPHTAPAGRPDPQVFFGLARVRLVGATWLKRADTPIRGLAGSDGTGSGDVVASTVSTENVDLGYTPPPGVTDQAARVDANVQIGATQINERSLRILASGLERGERAETFNQFTTAGDKNFLKYRRLRVWARGRGPGWEEGDLHFYIKVGKDANNFYFFHAPAHTATWEPEAVVDFSRWLALRAQIEQAWLKGDPPQVYAGCPDSSLVPFDSAYVMCDGPYIVHVRDPATAPPNLAAVQELATGIWRVDTHVVVDQAELWVDDIRLSDVVQNAGVAAAADVTLTAANVGDFSLSLSRKDGQFRQLGEDPSYATDGALSMAGTVQLQRFLPDAWGVAMPLSVRYARTRSDPFYLSGTDIQAAGLSGLRTPSSSAASYSLALRHARRSTSPLWRALVDPFAFSGSYTSGTGRSDLSLATASTYAATLVYATAPAAARLGSVRLTPTAVRLQSSLAGTDGSRSSYAVPIALQSDSLLRPARSLTKVWRNAAGVDFLPVSWVQLHLSESSQRDLRDYGDSTTLGRLLAGERRSFFGQDVGVETQRAITTFLGVTPRLGRWLRPRLTLTTSFSLNRDPNAPAPVRELGDTAGAFHVPAAFSNLRRLALETQLDARGLGRGLFGDSAVATRLLGRLSNLDVSYSRSYSSTFFGAPLVPSLTYQLALGGFDSFLRQGDRLAGSAADNSTLNAAGALQLFLGLRVSANYQRTQGATWVVRGGGQVPLRTSSVEWPSGVATWNFTPRRAGAGRVIRGFSARLTYRRRVATGAQVLFSEGPTAFLTRTTERAVGPGLSVTWPGGVSTSYDLIHTSSDVLNAGNLFHTMHSQANATLAFAFRPPAAIARFKNVIRATAHYQANDNTSCIETAAQTTCVPYVDTRQRQAQLTFDTQFPPSLTAGLQMGYIVNEERQTDHKTAQLVFTAFVSLSTSVGQLR
jgi:Motility related/secretion protein